MKATLTTRPVNQSTCQKPQSRFQNWSYLVEMTQQIWTTNRLILIIVRINQINGRSEMLLTIWHKTMMKAIGRWIPIPRMKLTTTCWGWMELWLWLVPSSSKKWRGWIRVCSSLMRTEGSLNHLARFKRRRSKRSQVQINRASHHFFQR